MSNSYFRFKEFLVDQDACSMKVTTDACLFGAWVAREARNFTETDTMLDIGSGTGLLSLMVAQQVPSIIEGIELQEGCYRQSLQNIAASPWSGRIRIYHGDVGRFAFDKKYSVIFCNPPFYENDLKSDDGGKNLAHHDTGLTLDQLAGIISRQLMETGNFFLLLPARREEDLKRVLGIEQLKIHRWVRIRPTALHPANRIMVKGGFGDVAFREETMTIKHGIGYSADFTALLADYYLYLRS